MHQVDMNWSQILTTFERNFTQYGFSTEATAVTEAPREGSSEPTIRVVLYILVGSIGKYIALGET